jgi:hypothetical protein
MPEPTRSMSAARRTFDGLLRIFRKHYPAVRVTLRTGPAADFPARRDYAYCQKVDEDHAQITVAPKFARATRDRQRGLLAHELAHGALLCAGLDHTEAETDAVAEHIFGRPIYYDADDVQTWDSTAPGALRPRPRYLPR